jgi:DNA-binding CsgD family transcriptional regulator
MSNDSPKPVDKIAQAAAKSLAEAAAPYAELYPSIIPRLEAIIDSPKPQIRKQLMALAKAAAASQARRRERMAQLFGLTQTETRLAAYLADGGSVSGYAEQFEVSVGTVRSQLKSVFAKTGVNRQSALAALIPRL